MPLGIFRRLKRGNAKKGSSPQLPSEPLTTITNQRPAYYRTSNADQEYGFNETRTADNDSYSGSHRLLEVGKESISNRYSHYGNVEFSAQSGISLVPRDGSILEPVSSTIRDGQAQRPGSYYDISRKRQLLSGRSRGTHPAEDQQRNVSDASRISDRDSTRQDTIGAESANRSVNVVTHALRALKVRSVDMLHPKPTLRFEYEPVDDSAAAIDPFTAGDVRGLSQSQIRSLQVDDIADDMDSHAIRVALERDARRSMDTRRSVSNSLHHTRQSLYEGRHLQNPDESRPWPWRDSRELMDKDRDRRYSYNSQTYNEMLQELQSATISEKAEGVSAVEVYSTRSSVEAGPQSESDYVLDGPTLISSQGLQYEEQDRSTTVDYGTGRRSGSNDSATRRRLSSTGHALTTAWTSFLKRATAERIRREIELREFGGQSLRDHHPISTARDGFRSSGSPSGNSYYSSDSQNSNAAIQYVSTVPASEELNSRTGADSVHVPQTQRARASKHDVEVERRHISKKQHHVLPAEENYIYSSAVVSRRAQFVRHDEQNHGYKAETLT
ncbi:hypothetical protein V1509DRAFT_627215 [Lipomyces kononenkoae]